jgi:uncharacterized repeat protein (TIGR01451 family)
MMGWEPTTELPYEVSVVAGQDVTIHIGNRELPEEDVVKSFSLTFENAPEGALFYASFDLEGLVLVPLTGDGPIYTGEYELPHGTTITVTWWIVLDGEFIVLAEGEPETLTEDLLNELTYEASASGFKFDDVNADGVWGETESGMSGWTIYLYRIVESDPIDVQAQAIMLELYATTVTGEGGAYSFSGLVPGTYMVAEEDRAGWTMTVGPEGEFEVTNESAVEGLIFGNAEDALPFTPLDLAIEKVANVSEADPGDIVTYTLTFRNLGPGVAMNYTIVDDFDERYVEVVDSAGGVVADGKITWNLAGPLAAEHGPQVISYTVRIKTAMPIGETDVRNVVVISHPDDENLSNNSDDAIVSVDNPALPFTEEDEEPFLPFTGTESLMLGLATLLAAMAGLSLRLASKEA